jgi:transposase
MSATTVRGWARRDAIRIQSRVAWLMQAGGPLDRDDVDYLRQGALLVLSAAGDLPAGWRRDMADVVRLLDERVGAAK